MKIHNSINNKNNPTRPLSDIKAPVVHHTGTNYDSLNYLTRSDVLVSCHYLVKRNGEVHQTMDENRVAYHAGVSEWHSLEQKGNSLNWCTIGIEVESDGHDFTDEQRESTKELIEMLMQKYSIPRELVLRHKDISPGRKWDIGDNFFKPLNSWGEYQLTLQSMDKETLEVVKDKQCESITQGISAFWNLVPKEKRPLVEEAKALILQANQ